MRPRFSLKRLLVGVTALSVFLCTFFIYPTIFAHRFVAAVESGAAEPYAFQALPTLASAVPRRPVVDSAKVELLPRSWDDLWHFRRRVSLNVDWSDRDDPQFHTRDEAELDVGLSGIGKVRGNRYSG
jgi:hypothetical protein